MVWYGMVCYGMRRQSFAHKILSVLQPYENGSVAMSTSANAAMSTFCMRLMAEGCVSDYLQ